MIALHLKTGKLYRILHTRAINSTNGESDGKYMVIYQDIARNVFVREHKEFDKKFDFYIEQQEAEKQFNKDQTEYAQTLIKNALLEENATK